MCLYKDKKHHPHNKPLTAKEDIVCYKVLVPSTKPYYFLTPIVGDEINIRFHMKLQIPYRAKNSILFHSLLIMYQEQAIQLLMDLFIHIQYVNLILNIHCLNVLSQKVQNTLLVKMDLRMHLNK